MKVPTLGSLSDNGLMAGVGSVQITFFWEAELNVDLGKGGEMLWGANLGFSGTETKMKGVQVATVGCRGEAGVHALLLKVGEKGCRG